ncbi:MAG: DUF2442 domain-containing protein [Spirochaetaceae bacterium]|nr:DUF2442 domain-containing protein [Spirochaetaceae bacterium]MBQ7906014.1 DUF2442 domain-containing protein [Spirochaetaceae bacterium]
MYIKDDVCYAGELVPNIEVSSIKILEDGMMLIHFNTGETRLFDVTSLVEKGSVFLPLKDECNRKTAKVTHGFVSWLDGQIDIAPETMYMESYKYTKDEIA